MKRMTWAVILASGMGFAVPALADDPPAQGEEQKTAEATAGTASAIADAMRDGAGSMEPSEAESDEDRVEREFVTAVWNSP